MPVAVPSVFATHEQSEQARRDERSRSKAAASVSRRRPHGSRG
jgi:hypothetical protein